MWLCQERRKEPWRNHTGKAKNTLTSATKNVSIFPCHKGADPENFNCLFCYCPLYALGDKCGGNFRFTESGIKDCTECKLPHRRENFGYVTGKYSELAEIVRKQREK